MLLGVGPGALIAALSVSVVIAYRGSGTINFAAGAQAALGAYVFYGLRTGGYILFAPLRISHTGMGTTAAFLTTLLICGLSGLALDWFLYQKLRSSPPLARLIASVGVLLTIQALVILAFGGNGLSAPDVMYDGTLKIAGGPVPASRLLLLGLVAALTISLALVYRYTPFGLATRAAQEDEIEAMYSGMSPGRISSINSVLAAMICAAIGIVVAPLTSLDPNTLVLAVVPALGAALFARFTSFIVAASVGLAMGLVSALVIFLQTKPWFPTSQGLPLPGVSSVVYFALICLALIWRGSSLPQRGTLTEARLAPAPASTNRLSTALVLTGVMALGMVFLPADFRQASINSMIGTIGCLSLVVLTGFVGQVSLLPYSLAGVAGLVVSKLASIAHLGFPLAPLVAILIATLLGVATALPALRVRGVQLAILTVGAAVAISSFVLGNPSVNGGLRGAPIPSPTFLGVGFGPDSPFPTGHGQLPSPAFGLVCLAITSLLCLFVASLRRSELGRRMLAVRASERAASGVGLSPGQIKLVGFGISSALAAVAGVLLGYNFKAVDPANFDLINSLGLLAFAYMGGITTVRGALIGGLVATEGMFGHYLQTWLSITPSYYLLVAGLGLMVTLVLSPSGIALSAPPAPIRALLSFANKLKTRSSQTSGGTAP
jgi:branched-chain amino acid transport system permease protein